ncbi:MAG: isoleucine--tRNA ligase [Chloroflexi bacterium]|nr:isoleucine--tRNA ligase [Chloroflexota bacterium]MDL1885763.1 isoleucine--tRNA ligase [Anaerolineae bacterium CFX8]
MFQAVSAKFDIQKLERDQLNFWREKRIFQRTLTEREGAPYYVFYEGPPTANGRPGSHHVLARAFKDMFPRYKVMRGYYCLRPGGWDTHGLPVEIEVEKELGIQNKRQVEEYGIAAFNEKCRSSVLRYLADWEKLTERIGFWVDLDNAYITFTNDYIQSVWWILKQFWEKNLLYKGYKVVPYCTRCGTPLSSHEVAQGYEDVEDPSVFVRFPLRDKPGVYFLVWTTTPWTLPGNVALAVGENVDYVEVEGPSPDGEGTERLILAASLMEQALVHPEQYKVTHRYKGKDLVGLHYNPLYTFLPVQQDYAYVVAGDFVSTEDGTGIVHIAPAFGADDLAVGEKFGLPVLRTVGADGNFIDAVTKFRGMWFKEADPDITRDLKERGLLYKSGHYQHSYPFCWRCGTPLMYFARDTWFIRTTAYRDKLVALNQTINWVPEHVRSGRFGNWLEEVKDWALGRERFWGTPLPIWVDDQTGDMLCVGSVEELGQLAGRDLSEMDLHRPYVDEVTFPNPKGTGGTMRRVPELIDVWFDSGSMPVAQWGYPRQNQQMFESQFPADYICEAVDQTRGWFYSLHAISTMLFESVSFKNVICLGHILDAEGQKMSKSKGNIVDPWDVLNRHGADAFRWYLYTSGPPGESRRFSVDLVGEVVNKFWSTLWNTYSFFVTYANLDGWTPDSPQPPVSQRDPLDQWALAELHLLVKEVTEAYESYDVTGATRPVQAFVEQLSNWYVRLSRRRFWKGENDDEKLGAYATLYECLTTVARLIAPAVPFLSEALYRNLVAEVDKNAPESVHLSRWPEYDPALINMQAIKDMRVVQRLVSLGRAARESVNIRVRQPLTKAVFMTRDPEEAAAVRKLAALVESELNVKEAGVLEDAGSVVSYALNPLPSLLGKKFGKDFPLVQRTLREGAPADVRRWAAALLDGQNVTVEIDGRSFEVTPEEVEVKQQAAEGFAVAQDSGYLAALDTRLTDELVMEGLAREVVRRVQTMRKEADFNIADTIHIRYAASEQLSRAITRFMDYIRAETLGESLEAGEPGDGFHRQDFSFDGETLSLAVKRAAS